VPSSSSILCSQVRRRGTVVPLRFLNIEVVIIFREVGAKFVALGGWGSEPSGLVLEARAKHDEGRIKPEQIIEDGRECGSRDRRPTGCALITEIEILAAAARRAADRTGLGSRRADGKSPAAGSGVDTLSSEERARTLSSLRRRAYFL